MTIIKPLKITAYSVSPIHIGTGETLDPFSYVVKDKKLYRFETSSYLSKLDMDKVNQITEILKKPHHNTILESRKFIHNNFNYEKMKDVVFEILDLSKGSFYINYEKNLSTLANNDPRNKAINQLEIESTYSSNGVSLIPGSSIKGSIRTAIVNEIIEDEKIDYNNQGKNAYKELMQRMNLTFTDDIFKILKVSDFVPNKEVRKWIGYFLNFPKNSLSNEIGDTAMSVAAEVLMPFQGFGGEILIGRDKSHKYWEYFDKISNKRDLFKCLNRHYLDLFKKELKLFESKAQNHLFVTVTKDKFIKKLESNDCAVIKVGKHSGAEGVTFKNRSITIRGNKNRPTIYNAKEPTTVWYFSRYNSRDIKNVNKKENEIFPMGWLILI